MVHLHLHTWYHERSINATFNKKRTLYVSTVDKSFQPSVSILVCISLITQEISMEAISRRVIHSSTLGKILRPPCDIYVEISVLTDLTDMYVLKSISSRIQTYFVSILFEKPRDVPPMFCFDVQIYMKFHYNSSCLHRVGVVKSLMSVCTFKQNIGGTSRRVVSHT